MFLSITTKEGNFFEGEIKYASFKTVEGEIGIYEKHTPFTSILVPGVIAIDDTNNERKLAISLDGYVVVDAHKIIILTDKIIWASELESTKVEDFIASLDEMKIAKYEDRKDFIVNKADIQKRVDDLRKK